MDEAMHVDFKPFARTHPAMWQKMAEQGWTDTEALRDPVYDANEHGYWALWALPGVGARKILDLVNFLRDAGVELPWFAAWDQKSAGWEYLEGRRRADPRPGT